MSVDAFDHINICTRDVPGTAAFFADVLGMTVTASSNGGDPTHTRWVCDDRQRPIKKCVA